MEGYRRCAGCQRANCGTNWGQYPCRNKMREKGPAHAAGFCTSCFCTSCRSCPCTCDASNPDDVCRVCGAPKMRRGAGARLNLCDACSWQLWHALRAWPKNADAVGRCMAQKRRIGPAGCPGATTFSARSVTTLMPKTRGKRLGEGHGGGDSRKKISCCAMTPNIRKDAYVWET